MAGAGRWICPCLFTIAKMTDLRLIRKRNTEERLEIVNYKNADGSILPTLQFPGLAGVDVAQHFYTTRLGGVSTGYLGTLNLSWSRGDDPACVRENFRRVAAAFGTTEDHFVLTHQVHGTKVAMVTAEHAGCGVTRPEAWDDVDGVMTNVPGIILGTFVADCVPLLFVDPVHHAVAASHSGWRGTVGRMGAVTLQRMQEAYGTDPADVHVGIGPSICQDCYEVSDDVAEAFIQAFPGHQEAILIDKHNGHQQLNLWEACRITLLEAGVPASQIEMTDICTMENAGVLFSHRGAQGRRGNIGGFVMLRH